MGFDIESARKAGYSDDDIISHFKQVAPNFDVEGALKAGYKLEDISNTISQQPKINPVKKAIGDYFSQAGKFYTEDIPAVGRDIAKAWTTRIAAPTITETIATNPAVRSNYIANAIAGAPERTIRALGAEARTGLDILSLAPMSLNRAFGGLPGQIYNAYLNSPVAQKIGSLGGLLANTQVGKSAYELGTDPYAGPTLSSALDIAQVATGPKIPKATAVVSRGTEALGEQLIKPKVGEYIKSAPKVAKEALGENSKQQISNVTKTITDEGIHGSLRDPEALSASAVEKANNYVGQAYKLALQKNEIVGNPIEAGKKAVEDYIASGKVPGGNVKLFRNALKSISEDMSTRGETGYNKAMNETGIIDFKRALNPDWSKGAALVTQPAEAAKNQVRKLMYYGSDDLLKTPEVKALNDRATKLYRVSDALEGQVKKNLTAGEVLKTVGAVIAPEAISRTVGGPDLLGPLGSLAALIGLGTYSGVKSGAAGQTLLSLARMGKRIPAVADVTAMSPAAQAQIAKLNLSSPYPPQNMPGGKLGYIQGKFGRGTDWEDFLRSKGLLK